MKLPRTTVDFISTNISNDTSSKLSTYQYNTIYLNITLELDPLEEAATELQLAPALAILLENKCFVHFFYKLHNS